MSGTKGHSGRKRKTLTRERAIQILTQRLPKAVEVIEETLEGINKDRLRYEAAIEVKDSVMGKPKQQTEISGSEQLGVALVVQLFTLLIEKQRELKLLEEGNFAIQGQDI